jgi:hypothetical protein
VSQHRNLGYALFIVAAPITAALVYSAIRSFLPAQIAEFNNLPFFSDDPTTPGEILFGGGSQSVIAMVVGLTALRKAPPGAAMPRYGRYAVFYAWFTAWMSGVTMLQSVGAGDFEASQGRWWLWWVLLPSAIPLLVLHRTLQPRAHVDQSGLPLPESQLSLRPDERLVWTSSSRSRWREIGGSAAATASLTAAIAWSPAALAAVVIALGVASSSTIRTTIDRSGVTVHGFGRRIPRVAIALEDVRVASATELSSTWRATLGLSRTPLGRVLILNGGGPALLVEYGKDRSALISVDHASDGADVLNSLLAQLREAARSGGASV